MVLAVGSILLKSAHRTSLDEWHTTITQNLHAAFYVVRAVTDKMQRQPDGGSILLFLQRLPKSVLPIMRLLQRPKQGLRD